MHIGGGLFLKRGSFVLKRDPGSGNREPSPENAAVGEEVCVKRKKKRKRNRRECLRRHVAGRKSVHRPTAQVGEQGIGINEG